MKFYISVALVLIGFSASAQKSSTSVKFRDSQARIIEPVQHVYIRPLTAELKVLTELGKLNDVHKFTPEEVDALKGDISNLRTQALFLTCNMKGRTQFDVVVGALFDVKYVSETGVYEVTVTGYPAVYTNWKSAQPEDEQWIDGERRSNSSKATEAVDNKKKFF